MNEASGVYSMAQVQPKISKSAQKKTSRQEKKQKVSSKSQRTESPHAGDSLTSISPSPKLSQLQLEPSSNPVQLASPAEPLAKASQPPADNLRAPASHSLDFVQQPAVTPNHQVQDRATLPPPSTSSNISAEPAVVNVSKEQHGQVSQSKQRTPLPLTKGDARESEKLEEKKRQNVVTRTLWTFIMIGGFIGES